MGLGWIPVLCPSLWLLHDLVAYDCAFHARSLGVFGYHWSEKERKYNFTEHVSECQSLSYVFTDLFSLLSSVPPSFTPSRALGLFMFLGPTKLIPTSGSLYLLTVLPGGPASDLALLLLLGGQVSAQRLANLAELPPEGAMLQ